MIFRRKTDNVPRVLSDEPDKDAELRAMLQARQARLAFLAWLATHGDAWAWGDEALLQETLAAAVMLPDGVTVKVRTK